MILRYAEVLRNNAKFREARAQYARYAAQFPAMDRGELARLYASVDSAVYWMENPEKQVEVTNEKKLNSAQSEFGATAFDGALWFVSDRFGSAGSDAIYGWTGNPFLSLYKKQHDRINPVALTWKGRNYHIGPPAFGPVSGEVYYSVTREPDRRERRKAGKDVTVNIEIFSAQLTDEDWGARAQPFRFNNITEWSVGDPFLTTSGDTLFFTSTRPGGYGGTDIYYVIRTAEGGWGEAVNMGEMVNTAGNERFPVTDGVGNFYFSSDGHLGMGGLDVFRISSKVPYGKPFNLGYPFNSPQDDFSIRFTEGTRGYFSSNRSGGAGSDDIYSFDLNKKIQLSLEGTVYNAKTKLPVSGARVQLTASDNSSSEVVIRSDGKGYFRFNLRDQTDYNLTAEQVGFKAPVTVSLSTKGVDSSAILHKDIYLQPVEVREIVVLRNIYFDFDKSDIRPDAALELDKVLSFLNSAPTASIELSAHTDSRGSHAYNMKLSQQRANAAIDYLVSRGIERSRLAAKGYGFTRLVNQCAKGIKCTEEEHQYNRRVEFVVTKE